MDPTQKTGTANVPPKADSSSPHDSMDEFFNQIQSEMRRTDLSQEAVAAAFQAIQEMAHEGEPEKPMVPAHPHKLQASVHPAVRKILKPAGSAMVVVRRFRQIHRTNKLQGMWPGSTITIITITITISRTDKARQRRRTVVRVQSELPFRFAMQLV